MSSLLKKVADKASKKSKKKKKKKQKKEAEEGTNEELCQSDASVAAEQVRMGKVKKKKKKKKSSKQEEEKGTEQPAKPISSAPKRKKSHTTNNDSSPAKPEAEKTVVVGVCFLCKLPGHKARLVSWIFNTLFT